MGKQRRKFERGFKQQIVSEIESGALLVNAASRKYQLSGSVIDRWRRQARQGGLATSPSIREKALERENQRSQRKASRAVSGKRPAKKTRGLATPAQKRQYLRDHRTEFGSIAQGLQIMKLASSSYYYQPVTDLEAKQSSDTLLRDHIERLQQDFPGDGYRRLGRQLRREGLVVNGQENSPCAEKIQLFPSRWRSFKV